VWYKLGIGLLIGSILAGVFCYAYPMIYKRIELNITSKVFYGIWFETATTLPSGVEVSTFYYKKDLGIKVTNNLDKQFIGKLIYRSDLTEDPNRTSWRVKVYVNVVNASGSVTLYIEVGELCYINIRDKTGNMIIGYGLGCFDYTDNHYTVLAIPLTSNGEYEFYINHQYLWNEYTNPPDYAPWATFNVYLTASLTPGVSSGASVVVRYEGY